MHQASTIRPARVAYAHVVTDFQRDTDVVAASDTTVDPPARRGRVAPIVYVSAYLGTYLVGTVVFALFGGLPQIVGTWVNLALVIVFAGAGSWIFRDAWMRGWRLTVARPWMSLGLFAAGAAAIFVLPLIVGVIVLLLGGSPTGENQAQLVSALGGVDTWLLIALVAVVFGPIVEELVFREALGWRLRHRFPAWLLIVGSSLLFGLWHLKDVADLASVAVYATMGLMLAGVMWITRGNLLLAVLVHSFRNLVSVLVLLAIS